MLLHSDGGAQSHDGVRHQRFQGHAKQVIRETNVQSCGANRNVPDPRNWSGSGHRSVDNMMINLMQAITLTDEQFEAEVAKRRRQLGLKPGQTVIGCPTCSATPRATPATTPAGGASPASPN